MAQHVVTINVSLSAGTVTPVPFPIPNLSPGDEVIWQVKGTTVNQIQLTVGNNTNGVKLAVLDGQGNLLNWSTGGTGVNIPPPPPPPDVRNMIEFG